MKTNTMHKKGIAIIVIILFIGISVIPSTGINIPITGRQTIYVDDDNTAGPWNGTLEHPYQYIQDGIDNASNGDTVFVFNGTYYGKEPIIETQVKVNKTIDLIGENRINTIIDGGSGEESLVVVRITADWVNISGFTIQNGGQDGFGLVAYSSHTNVSNNNIGPNHDRVALSIHGSCNTVIGNNISFNDYDGIFTSVGDTIIIDNTISNNRWGIFISGDVNVNISGNNISHNDEGICSTGLGTGNCNISGNIFSNNNDAIELDLHYSNNIFSGNIFSDNGCGISLSSENADNIISGNNFTNNDIGVILAGFRSNKIFNNNFINNRRSATFYLLSLFNKWDGNYWDKPRVFPYPIIGCLGLFIPSWVNFDWHPASEPYDIGV
ncbi:nitrous oxidase accessory protein [Thermoplasmatales archaeon SCGC AB-540-F20]|nr:nitrous oxidase accessory protein [Thermoplasmatales archaeon SCGC AB-540-F20]